MMAKRTAKNIRRLYYGDNLPILRQMESESVDLIYLDPPFNSNRAYNIIYPGDKDVQVQAFEDTWYWSQECDAHLKEIAKSGHKAYAILHALVSALGKIQLNAYLVNMAVRLAQMHRLLKPDGSIYLHCDPTASHYLKIVMDAIFGEKNFRNEIAWCYRGAGYPKNDFGRRHDIILRYSKTGKYFFNLDEVREEYAEATKDRFKHYIGNKRRGGDFGVQTLHPKGKHPDDWWQIQPIAPSANERLGYPTQKPLALLERIVKASSKKGDLVFDPFCGCGTTIDAARQLGRNWIGIDITYSSIAAIQKRFKRANYAWGKVEVINDPKSRDDVNDTLLSDAYKARKEFEKWAVTLAGGLPNDKGGADGGFDGVIALFGGRRALVSVKSGKNVDVRQVRELAGLLKGKNVAGVFITHHPPTRAMVDFAKKSGVIDDGATANPRIQILTTDDLLAGKKPDLPSI